MTAVSGDTVLEARFLRFSLAFRYISTGPNFFSSSRYSVGVMCENFFTLTHRNRITHAQINRARRSIHISLAGDQPRRKHLSPNKRISSHVPRLVGTKYHQTHVHRPFLSIRIENNFPTLKQQCRSHPRKSTDHPTSYPKFGHSTPRCHFRRMERVVFREGAVGYVLSSIDNSVCE